MNNAELRIDARTVDEPGSNYDVTYQSSTTDSWLAESDTASARNLADAESRVSRFLWLSRGPTGKMATPPRLELGT